MSDNIDNTKNGAYHYAYPSQSIQYVMFKLTVNMGIVASTASHLLLTVTGLI